MTNKETVKLGDFGLSRKMDESDSYYVASKGQSRNSFISFFLKLSKGTCLLRQVYFNKKSILNLKTNQFETKFFKTKIFKINPFKTNVF